MTDPTAPTAGVDISRATMEGYATGLDALGHHDVAAAIRAVEDKRRAIESAPSTDIVLQTRYDALAREVQRVRNDRDATRAELATLRAEARAMRVALGLDHGDAPAAPARNFGG